MKTSKYLKLGGLGAMIALGAFVSKAQAGTTQNLDIHVSINASKSITAGTTSYQFGALAVNISSISATTLTLTNNSGGVIESYQIQGANAVSDSGGTNWTLAAAPALDTYALAAAFATARPAALANFGPEDYTTTSAVNCSATVFSDSTATETGVAVSPVGGSNDRHLWLRMDTPTGVTDPGSHTTTIAVIVR